MRDLSLHILDICMNSIKAEATLIEIIIDEQPNQDLLRVVIKDNGKGMDEVAIKQVFNPFYTTRQTRRVGFGLPLLEQNVKLTGGNLQLQSKLGEGTWIEANFCYSHIDRVPLGDLDETILSLIRLEPEREFVFTHIKGEEQYTLDTRSVKAVLEAVPIHHEYVIQWLKEDLKQRF
jgi:signal transduction histidine kinase